VWVGQHNGHAKEYDASRRGTNQCECARAPAKGAGATAQGDFLMNAFRICIVVLAALFTVHAAFAADENDRPNGIEAHNWLPISDRLGFVVLAEKEGRLIQGSRQVLIADPERVSAGLMPPKKGYFVIKTKAGWQRVVVSDLPEVAE
jgi:hypothetical protein